ncbi:MAG: 3-mercaptopyruvate sulfurtransferase [Hyphomicrobiales bacterium]|nr:3-mercaptopyruvate sulfurtransferase [Hyphomicrobiales bacterium]
MSIDNSWLVSTDWLGRHLGEADIILLDGSFHLPNSGHSSEQEYRQQRIPGARFFDINRVADLSTELPHMLPSPDDFTGHARAMGINANSRIIVYDMTNMSGAARVWWMFRAMGFDAIAVLDGGFQKWKHEGRTIETSMPERPKPGDFAAAFRPSRVRSLTDIEALIGSGVQIVDARSAERFRGDAPEPRAAARLGHIPGSLNVPFAEFLSSDGTMLAPGELAGIMTSHDVDADKPVIATCGSGVTACMIALALAITGNDQTAVYDGSWAEWCDSHAPVETGPPSKA